MLLISNIDSTFNKLEDRKCVWIDNYRQINCFSLTDALSDCWWHSSNLKDVHSRRCYTSNAVDYLKTNANRRLQESKANKYSPKLISVYITEAKPVIDTAAFNETIATLNYTNSRINVLLKDTIAENKTNSAISNEINNKLLEIVNMTSTITDLKISKTEDFQQSFDNFSFSINKTRFTTTDIDKENDFKENLSIVEMKDCADRILNQLNLTSLYTSQLDFQNLTKFKAQANDNKSVSSKDVYFVYYNPITGQKIENINSICDKLTYQVIHPLKINDDDLKNYNSFKNQLNQQNLMENVNIFNAKNFFYTNPCTVVYNGTSSQVELTFEERLKFQKFTSLIDCGQDCFFDGFDPKFQMSICNCTFNKDTSQIQAISNQISSLIVTASSSPTPQEILNSIEESFQSTNFKVAYCYQEAFDTRIIQYNLGFYSGLILTLLGIFSISLILIREKKAAIYYSKLIDIDRLIFCEFINRKCMQNLVTSGNKASNPSEINEKECNVDILNSENSVLNSESFHDNKELTISLKKKKFGKCIKSKFYTIT